MKMRSTCFIFLVLMCVMCLEKTLTRAEKSMNSNPTATASTTDSTQNVEPSYMNTRKKRKESSGLHDLQLLTTSMSKHKRGTNKSKRCHSGNCASRAKRGLKKRGQKKSHGSKNAHSSKRSSHNIQKRSSLDESDTELLKSFESELSKRDIDEPDTEDFTNTKHMTKRSGDELDDWEKRFLHKEMGGEFTDEASPEEDGSVGVSKKRASEDIEDLSEAEIDRMIKRLSGDKHGRSDTKRTSDSSEAQDDDSDESDMMRKKRSASKDEDNTVKKTHENMHPSTSTIPQMGSMPVSNIGFPYAYNNPMMYGYNNGISNWLTAMQNVMNNGNLNPKKVKTTEAKPDDENMDRLKRDSSDSGGSPDMSEMMKRMMAMGGMGGGMGAAMGGMGGIPGMAGLPSMTGLPGMAGGAAGDATGGGGGLNPMALMAMNGMGSGKAGGMADTMMPMLLMQMMNNNGGGGGDASGGMPPQKRGSDPMQQMLMMKMMMEAMR